MSIYQPESFYQTSLASAITASQTTIPVTTAPNITSGFLVLEASNSNREIILYTGVSGTTLTGVTRGLAEFGSSVAAGTGKSHAAGVDISNRDVHYYFSQFYDFLVGTSATGSNSMLIGDVGKASGANRFWYVDLSSYNPFWGLSSNGKMVVSEDGTTSYVISAGGSGVTAGEAITITAGAVDLARLSTGGVALSANKIAIGTSSFIDRVSNAIKVDTTSSGTWSGLQTWAASSTFTASASFRASATFESGVTFNGSITGPEPHPNTSLHMVLPQLQNTSAATDVAFAVDELGLFPVHIPHVISVNKMAVYINGGHAAGRYAGIGIYSYDGATRYAYWAEQISAGTPGLFNYSVVGGPITLSAGAYLISWNTNNSSLRYRIYNNPDLSTFINGPATKWGYHSDGATNGVPQVSTGTISAYAASGSYIVQVILN